MSARSEPPPDVTAAAVPRPGLQLSRIRWDGGKPVPRIPVTSPADATPGERASRGAGTAALTAAAALTGGSLSSPAATVRTPAAAPVRAGRNVTVTVHRLPACSTWPAQPSAPSANGPVTVTPVTGPGPGPTLTRVSRAERGALSISTEPNASPAGAKDSRGKRWKA